MDNQNPFEAPQNQAPQNAAGAPPTPQQSQMPAQPAAPQGSAPITSVLPPTPPNMMANGAPKKSHLGLILGIVGGVVGLAVIAVVLIILLAGGGMNAEKFVAAIDDEKAINCEVQDKGTDNKVTIQTTDGWDKIRIYGEANGTEVYVLGLKDDNVMYVSSGSSNVKVKYSYGETMMLDGMMSSFKKATDRDTKFVCPASDEIDWDVPSKDWTDGTSLGSTDTNNTNSNSSNSSNSNSSSNNSNNSQNSATGKEKTINATIEDTKIGTKYVATKMVYNAFTIPQSVIDAHMAYEDKIPVLVYVTATNNSDSLTYSAYPTDVSFRDGADNSLLTADSINEMKQLAKDAGYEIKDDYSNKAARGASASDWRLFVVDPNKVSESDIFMYHKRYETKVIGSGETIPAEEFKSQLK